MKLPGLVSDPVAQLRRRPSELDRDNMPRVVLLEGTASGAVVVAYDVGGNSRTCR